MVGACVTVPQIVALCPRHSPLSSALSWPSLLPLVILVMKIWCDPGWSERTVTGSGYQEGRHHFKSVGIISQHEALPFPFPFQWAWWVKCQAWWQSALPNEYSQACQAWKFKWWCVGIGWWWWGKHVVTQPLSRAKPQTFRGMSILLEAGGGGYVERRLMAEWVAREGASQLLFHHMAGVKSVNQAAAAA